MSFDSSFLNEKISQTEFSDIVGVSKSAVSGYIKKGVINPNDPLKDWIRSYCDNLRKQAGNNYAGNQQESLTQARINDLNSKSKLNELKFQKEIKNLIFTADVSSVLSSWASHTNREVEDGVDKIVLQIKDEYKIEIDKNIVDTGLSTIKKNIIKFTTSAIDDL